MSPLVAARPGRVPRPGHPRQPSTGMLVHGHGCPAIIRSCSAKWAAGLVRAIVGFTEGTFSCLELAWRSIDAAAILDSAKAAAGKARRCRRRACQRFGRRRRYRGSHQRAAICRSRSSGGRDATSPSAWACAATAEATRRETSTLCSRGGRRGALGSARAGDPQESSRGIGLFGTIPAGRCSPDQRLIFPFRVRSRFGRIPPTRSPPCPIRSISPKSP